MKLTERCTGRLRYMHKLSGKQIDGHNDMHSYKELADIQLHTDYGTETDKHIAGMQTSRQADGDTHTDTFYDRHSLHHCQFYFCYDKAPIYKMTNKSSSM